MLGDRLLLARQSSSTSDTMVGKGIENKYTHNMQIIETGIMH
jgi:hypothetical protein